jgi:hypothetical protein
MNRIPPKVLLIGGAVILILVMLAGLRHQVSKSNDADSAISEQADADDGSGYAGLHKTGAARIGRLNDDSDKRAPRTYKPSKAISKEMNEDFESQKLRAVGDSHISGRVFSRSREIGFKPI